MVYALFDASRSQYIAVMSSVCFALLISATCASHVQHQAVGAAGEVTLFVEHPVVREEVFPVGRDD